MSPLVEQDVAQEPDLREAKWRENLLIVLLLGTVFGVLLVKSEVISWFRIQEMFRFQSIHMYGILGSAVVVAGISLALLKRFGIKTVFGEAANIPPRDWERGRAQLFGGTIFGLGWALLGACPGPLYALIGSGVTVIVVALASAVAGVWVYGYLRPKLPH
jgi:uncharacterized membrane protein YedE/YeeE